MAGIGGWATAARRAMAVGVFALVCGAAMQPPPAVAGSWSAPVAVDPGVAITSVSCQAGVSRFFCAAVDEGGNVLTFNGSSWTAPINIDGANKLTSVACSLSELPGIVQSPGYTPPPPFCEAVDASGHALRTNFGVWSAPTTVDGANRLTSVSGWAVDANGNAVVLGEPLSSSPAPISIAPGQALSSLAASNGTAVAVGGSYAVTYYQGSWGAPTMIDPSAPITAVSHASVYVAVDQAGGVLISEPGIMPRGWKRVQVTNGVGLRSVSCTGDSSPEFCAAVTPTSATVTMWPTTSWPAPETIDAVGSLTSVSCSQASNGLAGLQHLLCVAVDSSGNALTYTGPPPINLPKASVGKLRVHGTAATVQTSCVGSTAMTCGITLTLTVKETLRGGKLIAVGAKAKTTSRTVTVGAEQVALAGGQSKTIRVKLNATGQHLLSGRRKLSATLTATQPCGSTIVCASETTMLARKTVTFKAAKK